jgi:chromosome segregation ATPase
VRAPARPSAIPAVKPSYRPPNPPVPSFPPESGALVSAARYHRQLSQLQEQLADAQRDLALTNQERASEAEHYDELEKQVLVFQHKIGELESSLGVQRELRAAAKDREEELEKEISSLRDALDARLRDEQERFEAEKINAELQAVESQRVAMEAQLVDRDLELARLRGEVVSVRELKASRSRELTAVRATAEQADTRLREVETQNASMRRELEKLRMEMARNLSEQLALSAELRLAREESQALRGIASTVCELLDGIDKVGNKLEGLRGETAKALERAASAIMIKEKKTAERITARSSDEKADENKPDEKKTDEKKTDG